MAQETAAQKKADFITYSEPNKKVSTPRRHTYVNRDISASIVNFSKLYSVRSSYCGECYVAIQTDVCRVYSVYISPNCSFEYFVRNLEELRREINRWPDKSIITGDFNAKHTAWGGNTIDRRGEELLAWTSSLRLEILNDGKKPTLIRVNGQSYIDLTLVTSDLLDKKIGWEVLDTESLSDHQYVYLNLEDQRGEAAGAKWCWGSIKWATFEKEFEKQLELNHPINAERCTKMLTQARKKSSARIRTAQNGIIPYWWNEKIQDLRTQATKQRRRCLRIAKQGEVPVEIRECYKQTKKDLRHEINKSKKEKWRTLCEDLENDVFGQAYKIITGQLRIHNPRIDLDEEGRINAFKDLFKEEENPIIWEKKNQETLHTPPFEEKEVAEAANKIKTGKAPGPDTLTPETLKLAIQKWPRYFQLLYNLYLLKNEFPAPWKVAKLVLIDKPKKTPEDMNKYRPICLLNVVGKVYEHLINRRLIDEIEAKGDFSERQFGFRKGRSTIHAVQEVLRPTRGPISKRPKWCALVLVDVRNAFNTASWRLIIRKLELRGISEYLINIVKDYLSNRKVEVTRGNVRRVGAGVPQGSVIGPTLWNVLYDDVMKIDVPDGVRMICYADDLAVVVTSNTKEDLMNKTNESLHDIHLWMRRNALQVAAEKTTAVLLNRFGGIGGVVFEMGNARILPSPRVDYLGITIDQRLRFSAHVKRVTDKACRTARVLGLVLPNNRGLTQNKRKTMYASVQSIVLYGAPIWSGALEMKTNRDRVMRVQRQAALRICSAYCTVSNEALAVVSGTIPIHLMAKERSSAFEMGNINNEQRKQLREGTLDKWQSEWRASEKGEWTRKLIPDLRPWLKRKWGVVDYHITQCLTGHGCFMAYVYRIKRRNTPTCIYCEEVDDVEHSLFCCKKWESQRREAERKVGKELRKKDLVDQMLESRDKWNTIGEYIREIMKIKEIDERELQR